MARYNNFVNKYGDDYFILTSFDEFDHGNDKAKITIQCRNCDAEPKTVCARSTLGKCKCSKSVNKNRINGYNDLVYKCKEKYKIITPIEEYEGSNSKIQYMCLNCECQSELVARSLSNNIRDERPCSNCENKTKDAYNIFVNELIKIGWKMLTPIEEYTDSMMRCDVLNANGQIVKKRKCDIINGHLMTPEEVHEYNRKTIKDVKDRFEQHGFELLDDVYVDNKKLMKYKCKCGRIASMSYSNCRDDTVGCYECAMNEKRVKWNVIEDYFEDQECTLLTKEEEYSSNNEKLRYICNCGDIGETSWKRFKSGSRCINCKDERMRNTNIERYGTENVFQSDEIKDKIRSTNINLYGAPNAMQNHEIFSKHQSSCYNTKNYILTNNKKQYTVQGYEHFAIDYLLQTCLPNDIVTKTTPTIEYMNPVKNRMSTYFPDIFIPKHNTIIEIKSEYTFNQNQEQNMAKWTATADEGYNMVVIVFNRDGSIFHKEVYGDSDNNMWWYVSDNAAKRMGEIVSLESSDKESDQIIIYPNGDINLLFDHDTLEQISKHWSDIKIFTKKSKDNTKKMALFLANTITEYKLPTITKRQLIVDLNKVVNRDTDIIQNVAHGGQVISYFMIDAMLACKHRDKPTINDVWKDENLRRQLWECVLRLNIPCTWKGMLRAFGMKFYKVGNFPCSIARTLYDYYLLPDKTNKRVLDFSSGFGGRLVGFWASNTCTEYVGIDPNPRLIEPYKKLVRYLKKNNPRNKSIRLFHNCAERFNYDKVGMFDIIFTSPPYFNLEIYGKEKTQSCNKYNTIDVWMKEFLFKSLKKSVAVLKKNGVLCINIKNNKQWMRKNIDICKSMKEYIINELGLVYMDKLILPVMKRPGIKNKNDEPIYIFSK